MSTASIVAALIESETLQQSNLMDVLGAVKGSRTSSSESRLPSIVRGLCTNNKKLISLAAQCLATLEAEGMEAFKGLVNDFILWFDSGFVVFEKYLLYMPAEIDPENTSLLRPILHCRSYLGFIEAATAMLRNPFVVDKLAEFKERLHTLLDSHAAMSEQHKLNNISFDSIQAFGGCNVSCYFTVDQIYDRSNKALVFMGSTKVELLLLNLEKKPKSRRFNSLVILKVPHTSGPRSVLYPPFRVNELSMTMSHNCINFSPVSWCEESSSKQSFSITGSEPTMEEWYNKLRTIFPTKEKLLLSLEIQCSGLGINTVSDSSGDETPELVYEARELSSPSPRASEESSAASSEIMRKTLSNIGIEATEDLGKHLKVVNGMNAHQSIEAEYGYADDAISAMESVSLSDDADGFEMVNAVSMNKDARSSLPELSVTQPPQVYRNAAGSAIDINNFGKNYNPSFTSTEDLRLKTKKKSLFGFLKKNKSKASAGKQESKSEVRQPKMKGSATGKMEETKLTAPETPPSMKPLQEAAAKLKKEDLAKKRPELAIKVPKIGEAVSNSAPLSATSSNFNTSLPLPFALPSSTSTYFFKPYINGSSASVNNASTGSLIPVAAEKPLIISQDMKDIINSDDTVDFYISPTTPKSLKVSKWKSKYGKWEMLTASDSVFVKIVANYQVHKSWLLVFKEEFDEEYQEVIDVPLLILNLDVGTKIRQSSALDIEVLATDPISSEAMSILVRCYSNILMTSLQSNLNNILEVMKTKPSLSCSSNFSSENTLSSSVMSKPSASSTLTSIYTNLERQTPPSTRGVKVARDDIQEEVIDESCDKLLLDRMTIKLHKQMESYEQIHQISSWKAISMYTLSISHSLDSVDNGFYHFDLEPESKQNDRGTNEMLWVFDESSIFKSIETIGKAGLLVNVDDDEIYMLECKGKKELKRLVGLF